jgi:hypothetical protein
VAALPPAHGQPSAKVANEEADQCVDDKVFRNGSMASIMRREHNLVLNHCISHVVATESKR